MYIKYVNINVNTYIFFILFFLQYIKYETRWKGILFHLESFVDKTTFNPHSFNKINDFATSQFATIMFYLSYLKP